MLPQLLIKYTQVHKLLINFNQLLTNFNQLLTNFWPTFDILLPQALPGICEKFARNFTGRQYGILLREEVNSVNSKGYKIYRLKDPNTRS